ncbi:MAG: alpha/beta fold hydrolase [Rhodobacteraceae bacterium]|nr:alpha/beta fold hydrolase [Paracoccaceae bacterium]
MARFLLIHGSGHGAWCWRGVLPFLNTGGHQARAIDLPSHGDDKTPADQVTLDGYARAIVDAIDEPVILVGHSMAGYPITAAAELAPEKVAKLVYLCAYVPVPGLSLADRRRAGPRQPLLAAIRVAPDRVTWSADPDQIEAVFYHDCPPGTVAYARARLTPQPILPQETVLDLTARSATIPRHYIRCTDDRTIPPEYQEAMTADWPASTVTTLPTSHSPFFAAPAMLAERLIEIAAS